MVLPPPQGQAVSPGQMGTQNTRSMQMLLYTAYVTANRSHCDTQTSGSSLQHTCARSKHATLHGAK